MASAPRFAFEGGMIEALTASLDVKKQHGNG
jgi:hypothetical protein